LYVPYKFFAIFDLQWGISMVELVVRKLSPACYEVFAAICAERKDDSLGKEMRDQNGEHHQAVRQQGHR
jgi:hypothetical protein